MTTTIDGITLALGAATDIGLRRSHNEDALLADPPVLLVADGMGGYDAGDLAAAAIVTAFNATIPSGSTASLSKLNEALEAADQAVAEISEATERGAGATVAGALLISHESAPAWLFFNVGDARVYRYRSSELQQVTIDHSLGQEMFAHGQITAAELASFPDRNIVTRAIGATDTRADVWIAPVMHGERILVCSDGLPVEVDDEEIRATLARIGGTQAAADALVRIALHAGGRDNVTVVIADVVSGGLIDNPIHDDRGPLPGEATEPKRRDP